MLKNYVAMGDEDYIDSGFPLDQRIRFMKLSFAKAPWNFSRVVKAIVKGQIYKLQFIIKNSKLTRTELLETRGLQCNHYGKYSTGLSFKQRSTQYWNPVLYAIYFRQYETLDYFFDDLQINARLALALPNTVDEASFPKQQFSVYKTHETDHNYEYLGSNNLQSEEQ